MTLPSYVGRYRVCDEIARGGFATVVRAWDEELESFVAIKILHPNLADDDALQLRFLEEARLLRRIRSPNVITVHDIGRLNDSRPYFVMDYADRGTLAARIRPEPPRRPDPQELTVLIDAVADGLCAIHEAGIVHRDIKPANILFQAGRRALSDPDTAAVDDSGSDIELVAAEERILVGDLGIAKDVAKHGPLATMVGGTPLYQAPEQREGETNITLAADIYAATALLWHVLTGQRPPNAEAVPSRLPNLPSAWHHVMEQGLALDPDARFTTIESWRSAVHDVLAHEVAEAQIDRPTEIGELVSVCPYKGLAAYQPEDVRSFFGREALIDDLVRRVQLQRVLVVGGPSGSGKSSLVRAGLIPALGAGALQSSDAWRIALFTPGRDPLAELHYRVTRSTPSDRPAVSLEDLIARPTIARHLGEADGSQAPLLLCIDQFEELFTLAPESQRSKFITALSAMTDPADSKVRVVIAVRADFYAACAEVPWLAERITGNQVLVGPMTRSELRRAISEPARRAGLYVERNLVEAIIDEAGEEAGSLPLIAHALVETWIRRQGNTLTIDGFREAGGVAGAISQTADATYENSFNDVERKATKRLFLRLVTPGEGTPDTRRVLARAEIDTDSEPEVMQRVVERLTDARLLTVDDASVQIAHEALLRTWPRLHGWIEEGRDDLRTRQRISRAAAEWDAAERETDLLYRGTPLLSAQEWMARNPDQLGELELAFVNASAAAKAEAEAIAAERQRRARRTRRLAVGFLSLFAVGASAASVLAFLAMREARQNEERAELATAVATERFAGALGATASGLVESDPLLALSLAAEAISRASADAPGYDARASMIAARQALTEEGPFIVGSPISAGDALAIAMTPDGSLLATAKRDGSIDLIDLAMRQPVGPSLRLHSGGVQDVAFTPDGRQLASAGDDGTVRIWTVGDGLVGQKSQVGQVSDVVWDVDFDPQGSVLATASEDGELWLWDVETGTALRPALFSLGGDFQTLTFSPDGRGLLAGDGAGTIYGWALPSGEALFDPVQDAHTSDIWKLAFSPAGDRFATQSSDGRSMIIAYPSGKIIGPAFAGVGRVDDVVFAPDGNTLVGGGDDGALRLWNVDEDKLVAITASGHSQAIIDVELSQDGRLLATLGRDQLVRLWSMGTSHALGQERTVAGQAAKGLAISSDGARLAAGDESGVVQVWQPEAGGDPLQLNGHGHQVWAVAFSPNGQLLASGDRSGELRLWDAETGALRWSAAADGGAVWSLAFSQDGTRLISASDSGVQLWEAETGAVQSALSHDGGHITRAVLSPDDSLLAVTTTDGRVRLWETDSETLVREIQAEDDVLWSAAFSPDGQVVATASSDEVVALWDVESGNRVGVLTGHMGGATDLAYLGDGVTIVVTDRTGQLHWWDAATGRRLDRSLQAHAGASWRIAVHPDGKRFATTGDDGRVILWDLLSVTRACEVSRHAFDATRREQYLGVGEGSVACQ